MNMKRIEAPTLEEAYMNAAKEFGCSITEINYEIVQRPTTGLMGLFKKTAIIVAVRKISDIDVNSVVEKNVKKKVVEDKKRIVENKRNLQQRKTTKKRTVDVADKLLQKQDDDRVLNSFFDNKKEGESKRYTPSKTTLNKSIQKEVTPYHKFDDDRDSPANKALSIEIEKKLTNLMESSCFDIDTIEVDVFNNIAHIFVDGEDAALLIGKEGYRYNALSYMLFNWINAHYGLYIKLEIAEFIQAQEEMIVNYLKPIIEHIKENGRGKTKPLDGILVQIALELLRAEFPNKYVAIKTAKDSRKFIIINNFNNKKNG